MAAIEAEPRQSPSMKGYYYRSIATTLPIIVRVQCLQTDLTQVVHAVLFD
jgi:hypothetical protein